MSCMYCVLVSTLMIAGPHTHCCMVGNLNMVMIVAKVQPRQYILLRRLKTQRKIITTKQYVKSLWLRTQRERLLQPNSVKFVKKLCKSESYLDFMFFQDTTKSTGLLQRIAQYLRNPKVLISGKISIFIIYCDKISA